MGTVTREDLVTDVKTVLEDVEALLQQAGTATGAQAYELRERAATKLRAGQEKLRSVQANAIEKGRAAAQASDTWVRDHPWQAIGLAAGAAFLIGLLVSRR